MLAGSFGSGPRAPSTEAFAWPKKIAPHHLYPIRLAMESVASILARVGVDEVSPMPNASQIAVATWSQRPNATTPHSDPPKAKAAPTKVYKRKEELHKLYNGAYCARYGYACIVDKTRRLPHLKPHFEKLAMVSALFEQGFRAVLLLDDDAFILRPEVSIEHWLTVYQGDSLIAASHGWTTFMPAPDAGRHASGAMPSVYERSTWDVPHHTNPEGFIPTPYYPNTGVLLFVDTTYTRTLLGMLLENNASRLASYNDSSCCFDQDAILAATAKSWQTHVGVVPGRQWQCHPRDLNTPGLCIRPFVLHISGKLDKQGVEHNLELMSKLRTSRSWRDDEPRAAAAYRPAMLFSPSAKADRIVILPRLCSAGVLHASGQVCCNATCGLCGGLGCSSRPGGPHQCCMPAILRKRRSCQSTADVACILHRGAAANATTAERAPPELTRSRLMTRRSRLMTRPLATDVAIVSFMAGTRYHGAITCLARRLEAVGSRLPFVVVHDTSEAPFCNRCKFVHASVLYARIGYSEGTNATVHYGRRLFTREEHNHLYLKLWAWTLVEYRQVLSLDADILLLKNIDWWTNFRPAKAIATFPACNTELFNSGTILLRPSLARAQQLMRTRAGRKACEMKIGDQSVLNAVFAHNWQKLPSEDRVPYVHWAEESKTALSRYRNASLIHFVGEPKPWREFDACFTSV